MKRIPLLKKIRGAIIFPFIVIKLLAMFLLYGDPIETAEKQAYERARDQ